MKNGNEVMPQEIWYNERVNVELFFERLMESENLPYESRERKKMMEEGRERLEALIARVFERGVEKGKLVMNSLIFEKLKPVFHELEDNEVILRVSGMSINRDAKDEEIRDAEEGGKF